MRKITINILGKIQIFKPLIKVSIQKIEILGPVNGTGESRKEGLKNQYNLLGVKFLIVIHVYHYCVCISNCVCFLKIITSILDFIHTSFITFSQVCLDVSLRIVIASTAASCSMLLVSSLELGLCSGANSLLGVKICK